MGRPRRELTEPQKREIARLFRRGLGRPRIARAVGESDKLVRRVLAELGLERTSTRERRLPAVAREYLLEHAGEQGARELVKSLARECGVRVSESRVRQELASMGLSLPELRTSMTLRTACRLTGRSEPMMLAEIRRGALQAYQQGSSWHVLARHLRRWMVEHIPDINLDRVGDGDVQIGRIEVLGLLAGTWGVEVREVETRDQRRERMRRAKCQVS